MKKIFISTLGAITFTCIGTKGLQPIFHANAENNNTPTIVEKLEENKRVSAGKVNLQISAKSAYLMDFNTETCVFEQNATKHLPIASMCKIMTLILVFDAIKAGNLSINEQICVSERAASMGGSQVFLEPHAKYPVSELIKSIVVCSANDSCVALAEKIAGDEQLFVDKMNDRAKDLGANDTLFANCTGLPKEPQYSCAKDVAIMLKELLSNQEYFEYGKVWMDKFQHPKGRVTEISNTNKLVRFYDGCDGGKTGFTNQAGYCLAATAKRNGMRVISVVIGEENSKTRFHDVTTMFDYVFANYTLTPIVTEMEVLETKAYVQNGKEKVMDIAPERSSFSFTKRGEKGNIIMENYITNVQAPVKKGDKVGEIVIYENNVEIDRVNLLAMQDVEKANYFDRFKDIAKGWTKRK